jgi:zinc protease
VKRTAILTIVIAAIGFALWQTAWRAHVTRAQTPTVNSVLNHYVTALGGRDAIQRMKTRIAKGTIEVTGVDGAGSAEAYAKAPNKYATVIRFASKKAADGTPIPGYESMHGFDGTSGWVSDPKGLRDVTGQELAAMRRDSEFYDSLRITDVYPKLALKGTVNVAMRPAYEIDADPGDGSFRRLYFDVETGLLVRNDEELDTADGRESTLSYIEDYRDVEGMKHPFTIREIHGDQTVTVHIIQILINQPIDDAKFAKPVH